MRLLMVICSLLWLVACGQESSEQAKTPNKSSDPMDIQLVDGLSEPLFGDLDAIRQRGLLRVLVTHSRTDFFVAQGKILGIQAEFIAGLEKQLNKGVQDVSKKIRIEFYPVAFEQLIPALVAGKGDLIANFLTVTPERENLIDFKRGNKVLINEIVVGHKSIVDIKQLDDLAGRDIHILRGSSYLTHLTQINESFLSRGLSAINIIEADATLLSEDILELVNAGIYSLTVMDDFRAKAWQKSMPNIQLYANMPVASGNRIGWGIRKNSPLLSAELQTFIRANEKGTLIGNILFSRYFKRSKWIKNPNLQENTQRLKQYKSLFKTYAIQYGHDQKLLEALAFQESGLDHSRKSHRGAVGLMQLLPTTAADKMVNIADISSPENNIHAGAKYLAFIRDRYFSSPDIAQEDKEAFMLAAYNAGPAKVRKMRELAKKLGLNPNIWFGHVAIAAARLVGRETPTYVANIKKYHLAYRLTDTLDKQKNSEL